jgi:hypothetical protein
VSAFSDLLLFARLSFSPYEKDPNALVVLAAPSKKKKSKPQPAPGTNPIPTQTKQQIAQEALKTTRNRMVCFFRLFLSFSLLFLDCARSYLLLPAFFLSFPFPFLFFLLSRFLSTKQGGSDKTEVDRLNKSLERKKKKLASEKMKKVERKQAFDILRCLFSCHCCASYFFHLSSPSVRFLQSCQTF